MKGSIQFLRTTVIGGLLFLVPIVVLAVVLKNAFILAHKVVEPLAANLHIDLGLHTPRLLAIALIVLFCFFSGLFARTAVARKMVASLETNILSNLPGYQFFKSLGETALGVEPDEHWPVVLAHLDDAWQLAFLIERLENGLLAVFVPDAPNPHSGSVHFMPPDCVKSSGISTHEMMRCLKRIGAGSNPLLGGLPIEAASPKPH